MVSVDSGINNLFFQIVEGVVPRKRLLVDVSIGEFHNFEQFLFIGP